MPKINNIEFLTMPQQVEDSRVRIIELEKENEKLKDKIKEMQFIPDNTYLQPLVGGEDYEVIVDGPNAAKLRFLRKCEGFIDWYGNETSIVDIDFNGFPVKLQLQFGRNIEQTPMLSFSGLWIGSLQSPGPYLDGLDLEKLDSKPFFAFSGNGTSGYINCILIHYGNIVTGWIGSSEVI